MAKEGGEGAVDDSIRRNKVTRYELLYSKLALIRPLIAVELPQLCPAAQEAVARFIVKGGKALLEIMASDEPFTGDDPCGPLPAENVPSVDELLHGDGEVGAGIGPMPEQPAGRISDHPKPGREG